MICNAKLIKAKGNVQASRPRRLRYRRYVDIVERQRICREDKVDDQKIYKGIYVVEWPSKTELPPTACVLPFKHPHYR